MGVKGKYARLFIGTADLSTKTASAEIALGVTTEEATAWQDTARTYLTTGVDSTITVNGYVSDLAVLGGGLEETMDVMLGRETATMVGVLLHEEAAVDVGMPVYILPATRGVDVNIQAPAAGILTIDGSYNGGEGGWKRGLLLWRGSITAADVKASVDFGTSGTAGGNCYLFIHSITGTATNAVISVASAATEGGAYSEEASFTFSTRYIYAAAMTGTIGRWLRIATSTMGGATAFDVSVVACVTGVTQPA